MIGADEMTATAAACLWCDAPLPNDYHDAPAETRVVRCTACGAGTTVPQPTAGELAAAYGAWYRPSEGRFLLGLDSFFRRSRGRLAAHLDRVAPPGPVLDVGAGEGVLLDALHTVGREAIGLERESSRPDVLALDISEVESQWAAIVFWHSLEHLPEPAAALAVAARLLAPGGVLIVAAPNLASWQSQLFDERWLALDLPRHLVHLSANALVQRLCELDLEIARVSSWRGGQAAFGWLHGLVGLLPGRPDLYDAVRRGDARRLSQGRVRRGGAFLAAAVLAPVALLCAAGEIAARRGGSIYVEARRG